MSLIDPNNRQEMEILCRWAAEFLELPAASITEGQVIQALRQLRDRRDLAEAIKCVNADPDPDP